jgi:hypothetical protein
VLPQAHGRFIAVAGQDAFIADTLEQVLCLAKATHPDDEGLLVRYVFPPGGPRIYAHRANGCSVTMVLPGRSLRLRYLARVFGSIWSRPWWRYCRCLMA